MGREAPALVSPPPESVSVQWFALCRPLLASGGVGEGVGAVVASSLGALRKGREIVEIEIASFVE